MYEIIAAIGTACLVNCGVFLVSWGSMRKAVSTLEREVAEERAARGVLADKVSDLAVEFATCRAAH